MCLSPLRRRNAIMITRRMENETLNATKHSTLIMLVWYTYREYHHPNVRRWFTCHRCGIIS